MPAPRLFTRRHPADPAHRGQDQHVDRRLHASVTEQSLGGRDGASGVRLEAELPPGTSIGEAHGAYFETPELWRAIKKICS